ncbi:MAG TPA: hypothetical protein VMF91_19915 [Bryobacteraceae bacterium]|nr:hypothetical protein [Bryobacteraceae bacterium]
MSETTLTFGELIKSGMISVTDGYRAKNSELGGTGLIFLRAGHVTDAYIDFGDVERFHGELTPMLQEKTSRVGDVIVTTKGNSTGRTSFVDATMPTFVYSPHLSRWRVEDKNKVNAAFLRYWSRSPQFVNQMRGLAASTDMAPYLSLRDQQRLEITLPHIDAQCAIGTVLGSLDDKIEQNRRTGRALEGLARATFKAWFVDFEPVKAKAAGAAGFPGMPPGAFAAVPDRLTDSPLGPVPEGWAVGTMGDLLKERGERVTPGDETRRLPYVPIDCITSKRVTLETFKSGEEAQSSLIRFQDGDILFGAMRPYFHKVCLAPFSGTTRTTCFVLVPRTDSDRAFALMLASEPATVQFATTHSVGSTIPYAKWQSSLHEMQCFLPPEVLRAAFGMFADSLLHLSNQTVRESAKLATLRDYLLPRLLSGEVRVVQPQSEEEPS